MIARLIHCWKINREIEAKLRARKALRPYRQAAARKAADTRRRRPPP